MSVEVVAYLGISLDGYITTLDEGIGWLEAVDGLGDNGYADFYETIGTVVIESRTFKWIRDRMSPYPYQE